MKNVRLGRVLFIGCLLGFLLVVLVIAAPAANAQVCPSWVDPIVCRQEDNRNILRNNRRQHEATLATSRIEQLIFRNGYYGYYDGGVFNPVYDRNRRPISKREGAITGAGVGAAIGSAITGNWRGAAGGAGAGALAGFLLSGRGGRGNDQQVDCSKRKLNRKEQETCLAIAAEQRVAIAQQQVTAQQDEAQRLAQTYYNRTGRPVDVRDVAGNLVADIPSGGSIDLPESSGGYRAYMRLPATLGKTAFHQADQRLARDGSGFVFIAPTEEGV